MERLIGLISTKGQTDPKHYTLAHPLFSLCLTISLCTLTAVWLSPSVPATYTPKTCIYIGCWFLIYFFMKLVLQWLYDEGVTSFYDMMWQCNVSLITSSVGMFLADPTIVSAGVASVAIDQTLWWLDLISFMLTGKFKVGVAGYLAWSDTSLTRIFTCIHHLWFIPLSFVSLNAMASGLTWEGFLLSVAVFSVLTNLSRLLVPFHLTDKEGTLRYVNVNCTHEAWADIKISWIHSTDGKAWHQGFPMLVFVWNVGNLGGFCLYKLISNFVLE